MVQSVKLVNNRKLKVGLIGKLKEDFFRNKYVYIMAAPVVAFYIIFHYLSMGGAIIAFKDYIPFKGIWASKWVGFEHFINFFSSYQSWRLIRNTIMINGLDILWGFPAPIIFALLINEIGNSMYKKYIQTVTYLPHFISLVVVCGIIIEFCSSRGLISSIIAMFGFERVNLLQIPEAFRPIYVLSGIWQNTGWRSIIYLSALTSINLSLYEAAGIDGAGRFKQMIHVTLPGILPTIIVLFILRIGDIMTVGFEKVILLYNPLTYETADVISSFVFRRGLQETDYSFATAVGLFNSVINFSVLITANRISRRLTNMSLW